jgi:hypothetical protein
MENDLLHMRKPKVNIFDDDLRTMRLLKTLMATRNYEVITFDVPVSCYVAQADECISQKPCADIIITCCQTPKMLRTEVLRQQAQKGCRVDIRNKAFMFRDIDREEQKMLAGLGCACFSEPFLLSSILDWTDECEKRINLLNPVAITRKSKRYHANIDMVYACNDGEKIWEGIVMNFSEGGLCLKISWPVVKGQSIAIKTDLPNDCKNASVSWVKEMAGGLHIAGFTCM